MNKPELTPEQITQAIIRAQAERLSFPFQPHQQIPDTDWMICLFQAGRGSGKTWTGAAWAALQAEVHHPNEDGVLVGPTFKAVREVMVENRRSGILAMLGDRVVNYNRSTHEITTRSGSKIYMRTAEEPSAIRGISVSWAWCDEIGFWKRDVEAWHDGLGFAMREAEIPKRFVTTTPKRTEIVRELNDRIAEGDPHVAVMSAATMDNKHLPETAVAEMRKRYEGTRLGRQELYGELLDDVEGALWRYGMWRTLDEPVQPNAVQSAVVAVDPAVTSSPDSDLTGIVVVALTHQGRLLAAEDHTLRGTSHEVSAAVAAACRRWQAPALVERNQGNMWVLDAIAAHGIPVVGVPANESKESRAARIVHVYEQGLVDHAPGLDHLELEMTTWEPDVTKKSPDRVDALVHGFRELLSRMFDTGSGGTDWILHDL